MPSSWAPPLIIRRHQPSRVGSVKRAISSRCGLCFVFFQEKHHFISSFQEKRKYPVGMAPPPKKKSQPKTYNCAVSGTNTTAPASSVGTGLVLVHYCTIDFGLCSGEKSRVSSICPSDVSDSEIAEQIGL
jgi:hypothetical protein